MTSKVIIIIFCGCFVSFVVPQTFQTITNREKEGRGGEEKGLSFFSRHSTPKAPWTTTTKQEGEVSNEDTRGRGDGGRQVRWQWRRRVVASDDDVNDPKTTSLRANDVASRIYRESRWTVAVTLLFDYRIGSINLYLSTLSRLILFLSVC